MMTAKTGRPVTVKTKTNMSAELPQNISKDDLEKVPQAPNDFGIDGLILWHKIWIWLGDFLKDSDYFIVQLLCERFDRLKHLKNVRDIDRLPEFYIGSNRSKVIHPIHNLIRDAEKDYLEAIRELGLSPKAAASIKSMEISSDTNKQMVDLLTTITDRPAAAKNAKRDAINKAIQERSERDES